MIKSWRLILKVLLMFIYISSAESVGQNSDLELCLLNIGLGSIVGGVGAIINRNEEDQIGKVLIRGMGKGAMGGYFVFESKRMIRYFDKTGNYNYVWPSKIINAAGASIIENSAANRSLTESFAISIGFSRIEIFPKDNYRLSFRIKPIALIGIILTSTKGDFNIDKSLKTGNFVFTTNHIENRNLKNGFTAGRVTYFGSSILILDTWEGETALPHEIIHVYQNESFAGINQYLNKPLNKISNPYYKTYSKIFYTEFHALTALGLYNLSSSGKNGYSGNIFEIEANYFTEYKRPNPQPPRFFN